MVFKQSTLIYLAILFSLVSCQASQFSGSPSLKAELQPKRGLFASFNDVPVVRGSSLRFSATDNGYSYYDFSWIFQPHKKSDARTDLLLGGPNSFIDGIYRMDKQANTLNFEIRGKWQRADSTILRVQAARLWLPAFADGTVYFNGENTPGLTLDNEGFPNADLQRSALKSIKLAGKYASVTLYFPGNDGTVAFKSGKNLPANLWDYSAPVLEINLENTLLSTGTTFNKSFSIAFSSVSASKKEKPAQLELVALSADTVWEVRDEVLPLLPQPRLSNLDPSAIVLLEPSVKAPQNLFEQLFAGAISRLWDLPATAFRNIAVQQTPKTLPAEGFYIRSKSGSIQIGYADTAGLRHAAYALAFLARPVNGKLGIPQGIVTDYPATSWRGIHMFVGPNALEFHRKMYEQILLPFRMNKVVLQCEQTDWSSQPGIRNPITMPLSDLVAEARFLRERQIELIPLIQSFGHMEWFFENGQNLDLATNPEIPYTLDIRKEKAQEALRNIWKEAVAATGAKILHFGLDEVDMIGWPKKDSENITDLWESHLPKLSAIANSHGAQMMLWGDMLLAPQETIDFGNATNPEQAKRRRAVIPPGSFIADWHYKAEVDPNLYAPSLDILQSSGLLPIASTWYSPENIRGFNLAAVERKLGTLQTTWADYESSEANMLKYLTQFGGYLLSLDYAWSGRKTLPSELNYDPTALWAKLYYRTPLPLNPRAGYFAAAKEAPESACGPLRFKLLPRPSSQANLSFAQSVKCTGLAILMETSSWAEENETLATIEILFRDGRKKQIPIRYGVHLRSGKDPRPVLAGFRNEDGQAACYLPLEEQDEVAGVVFNGLDLFGTTSCKAITLVK